jgi:hypothetical protein
VPDFQSDAVPSCSSVRFLPEIEHQKRGQITLKRLNGPVAMRNCIGVNDTAAIASEKAQGTGEQARKDYLEDSRL